MRLNLNARIFASSVAKAYYKFYKLQFKMTFIATAVCQNSLYFGQSSL